METYGSENTTELALALLEVQKQMQPATKDGSNPFTKSNYATLNSVMETCREPLLKNGILLTQTPIPPPDYLGGGYLSLMTKLIHAKSGQWLASVTVTPLPKADPQGMGSAITYCRRYALCAMLGIVTEDDDAEAAKMPGKTGNRQKSANNIINPRKSANQISQKTAMGTGEQNSFADQLPNLDGVTYQYTTSQDGRQCIIATGNTMPKKEILSGAGFRWNPQRKIWWKYSDAI